MSVAPHAGIIDFGTFTPPTLTLDGIQGEVPQPLIGQENYVLTGNGWSSIGALGGLTYQGTWDASTNTPTLVSSVGVQGYYYVVSVAGNTDLNGTTTWDVGDWAIFNGAAWQKIEGGTVGTFTNVITPQVTARTDNLTLSAISTGSVTINTASATNTFLLVKDDTTAAASTTGLTVLGASSGLGRLALRSNKALYVASGSSNNISFLTNSGAVSEGSTQMMVGHTASAVNYVQVTGATTGNSPIISLQGSDGSVGGAIQTKGVGAFRINSGGGSWTQLRIDAANNSINFLGIAGSVTGQAPILSASPNSSDTNVSLAIQPKGTGAIDLAAGSSGVNISNGGTVTAVTMTANGTYTSIPSVAITAPTTAGGVQAVLTAVCALLNPTIASGGTGYTLNDVVTAVGGTGTAASYTVTGVSAGVITALTVIYGGAYSALPTNPVALSGGTGSGASITITNLNVRSCTIGTAGSGYIEQPTITFSGGGGSGAAAYATVGSDTLVRSLGNNMAFYTPNGRIGFRVVDFAGATGTGYWNALGGTTGPQLRATGSTSAVILAESAVPIQFQTASTEQFRVAHTASAVNYIQAQGSATGNATGPIISMQGSDANISTQIQGKGTGSVSVLTPTTLGGTTGNTAELFTAKGFNTNQIWLRAYQVRNATGTDWTTASLRLGQRIDATDMSYIEFNPSGFAQGIAIQAANNQPINFRTNGEQFRVAPTTTAVNYQVMSGSATNNSVQYYSAGSDTNISMAIQPKGTGAINLAPGTRGINISNGGTVTNITRTNQGSGYTTITGLTWTASAPTTTGGSTATGTVTSLGGVSATLVGGGTGYTAGNVLTVVGGTFSSASTITVNTVSGGVITGATLTNGGTYTVIPANPVSVTGGSGTGATFNITYGILGLSITTAGSGYVEQPTITFSGGGGTSAAAYATVGSATSIKSLHTNMNFYTPNAGIGFQVYDSGGTGTNYWSSQAGSSSPYLYAKGSTNTEGRISSNGTSPLTFWTNGGGQQQFAVSHTASAVNYVQVTGGATGNNPVISTQGSDTNRGLTIQAKGVADIAFANGSGQWGFYVTPTANTSNQLNAVSSVTGTAPSLRATGSDTNISLNLVPKGTGTVQQNGNPLAQVNHKYHAFTVGSYYFDSYEQNNYFRLFTQNAAADTIRYGAVTSPEYYDYGTLTWTAWAAGLTGIQNLLDGNPNTGMSVAHANRTFRFVVANSDGWPTNALVVLQTTWAAITYTTATVTIASGTSAAGPFTTRQVMTFSSANSGNNWGMHAYYTGSIHTGNGFYQITVDITDWVDSGTYVTYPLINLNIFSNYSTVAGRMVPYSNSYDRTSIFIGGIRTAADVNGVLDIGRYSAADPTTYIDSGSNASRIILRTQYTEQLRLSHTASAVNYVQVTGAATGGQPTISAQGSDTNIPLQFNTKGNQAFNFYTNGGTQRQFRVVHTASSVNFGYTAGSATGTAVTFGVDALSSDTNIDLALTPKGTGRVKYGTHTATADAPITGYIEIVDSGGTIRKLAVIS